MDEYKSSNVISYSEETNHFLWYKEIYSLRKFVALILDQVQGEAEAIINEDEHHKMYSIKLKDCAIMYYQTTKKVIIQSSGSSALTTKWSEFVDNLIVDETSDVAGPSMHVFEAVKRFLVQSHLAWIQLLPVIKASCQIDHSVNACF